MVSPLEFIPIAEENGLIVPIGNWVIEEACTQNKAWQESGLPVMRVAVNVSSIQFNDKNFVDNVDQILNKLQLAPELLELEITESVMQDIEESAVILKQLGKIVVKTSINDFGTGYSSLSVLNRLPIDFVKIDKSFIDDIVTNSNTASCWIFNEKIIYSFHLHFFKF
jgi:EAL domain-containing protein (putative c-di-GMP-specific phosphodiesterase class I)